MTVKVDWVHFTQQKLRTQLKTWFEIKGVTTYEEAEKALRSVGLSVGSREEVVKHLPSSPNSNASSVDSNPAPARRISHSNKEVRGKSKKAKAPRSAAEVAADAITESAPVKIPSQKAPPKRSGKRKKS